MNDKKWNKLGHNEEVKADGEMKAEIEWLKKSIKPKPTKKTKDF